MLQDQQTAGFHHFRDCLARVAVQRAKVKEVRSACTNRQCYKAKELSFKRKIEGKQRALRKAAGTVMCAKSRG